MDHIKTIACAKDIIRNELYSEAVQNVARAYFEALKAAALSVGDIPEHTDDTHVSARVWRDEESKEWDCRANDLFACDWVDRAVSFEKAFSININDPKLIEVIS